VHLKETGLKVVDGIHLTFIGMSESMTWLPKCTSLFTLFSLFIVLAIKCNQCELICLKSINPLALELNARGNLHKYLNGRAA